MRSISVQVDRVSGVRVLTESEVEQVNGGFITVVAGALIGGAINGVASSLNGGSFAKGFSGGFVSGALVGSGVGIFATSAVAGTTLIGAGSALGVTANLD